MKKTSVFLLCISCFLFSCKDGGEQASENTRSSRPNLLIALSDQHSFDMIGAYGNEQIITPNLDQFAKEGMLLANAFSSQPVCTPFRGMIMSGMHPLKNGAFTNDTPLLPHKTKLLGQILKEEGYQTAYIGKWHLLGGDRDRPIPKGKMRYGFDTLLTNNCQTDFRAGEAYFWNDKGEKEYFDEWEVYGQTKQALSYLDDIDPERPFALIVSWHPPHDWGKFKGQDGKMHYRYDTLEELMALYDRDSIKMRPGLKSTPDRKRMYHGHMAMISGVDKAFGMLMDKLKELKLEENTVTLFSADHGDMLESHNAVLPKQYPHDYSNHIPFLIKFPKKIPKGASSEVLLGTMDIMPTVLGLMDIESNQKYDGKNLSKQLQDISADSPTYVPLWNMNRGERQKNNWRGVVTKEFTFAIGQDSLEILNVLYDRQNDPNQLNNLFRNPKYSAKREKLEKMTWEWMGRLQDKFYGPSDFLEARPEEGWGYQMNKSPLELLQELKEVSN
ncbi:sulfatase [Aggregatimonas sangjinii]|uniref:Sulfatase n=1 Tax=Aggregatimonas sangjinii TaxID=2583587 RepID=A0A5B7ST49_9FLAO|nr:sulfatase [Aggregatimonas sangjinii]QCX01372.1 sulfatase [Aggregatimonas sangjinii]